MSAMSTIVDRSLGRVHPDKLTNTLYSILSASGLVSSEFLKTTFLPRNIHNFLCHILWDLHVSWNPHFSYIAFFDTLSTTAHAHLCATYAHVLIIDSATQILQDCSRWVLTNVLSSVFIVAFLPCAKKEELSNVSFFAQDNPVIDKDLHTPSTDPLIVSASNDDDAASDISQLSFVSVRSEAASANASASAVVSAPSDNPITTSSPAPDDLISLFDDADMSDGNSDVASACSYRLNEVHVNVVQTRAMKRQAELQLEQTNKLNQENNFYPIPFGERCVLQQQAKEGPLIKICQNLSRRFDRINTAVTCTCAVRSTCQDSGHKIGCELCSAQYRGPKYHHAKATFLAKLDDDSAQASVDLICRGHKDLCLVMTCTFKGHDYVVSKEVASKSAEALVPAVWFLFGAMRHLYNIVIYRLHSDRESAILSEETREELLPIYCTYTVGGDHAANAKSERMNRTLATSASKSMSHLSCSATKRNLWSRAIIHSSYAVTMKDMPQAECLEDRKRLEGQTQVPFLALGWAVLELTDKISRVDARNKYCVYIGPCPMTSHASIVLAVDFDPNDKASTFCRGTKFHTVRGFTPAKSEDHYFQFPQLSFPGDEEEEIRAVCHECGLTRVMVSAQYEKIMAALNGAPFCCRETDAKCGKQQWKLCRRRAGRKTGYRKPKAAAKSKAKAKSKAAAKTKKRNSKNNVVVKISNVDEPIMFNNHELHKETIALLASAPDATLDSFIDDPDLLPAQDFCHGINADIENMMSAVHRSVHDVHAFKAEVSAAMVGDNDEAITANLTKLLTEPEDLKTPESIESIKAECHQLFNVDEVVAEPIEVKDALEQFPDATASPAMLIVSIKNYEFFMSQKKRIKNDITAAKLEIVDECRKIREDFYDTEIVHANLSGLSTSSLKTRMESVIAKEADVKEMEELLNTVIDFMKLEDDVQDGSDLVPTSFKDTDNTELKGASSAIPKWKCRIVVRGDIVQRLQDFVDRPLRKPQKSSDAMPSVWSATVSLTGFRAVVAHSVLHQYNLRSIDLPSAFVQVPWPDNLPPHFLTFPDNVCDVIDERFRGRNLSSPVWQMLRMIYGHRLSGWCFCKKLRDILLENGFESVAWCNAILIHKEKNICVCTYVDDMAYSCDEAGETFLLDAIVKGGLKVGDDAEDCRKYLGTKLSISIGDDHTLVRFDQTEYAHAIVSTYEELYGKKPYVRRFPGSWNVNSCSEPMLDLHDTNDVLPDDDEDLASDKSRRKRQVIIGMLLWHSRSVRADISGYVNYLATRVHIWSAHDSKLMSNLVGFLRFSAAKSLTWKIPHGQALGPLVSFDANLQVPKCHASYVVTLGNSDNQCFGLLDWANKKVSLACTASAGSELCAAFYAASNVNGLCQFLGNCIDSSGYEREDCGAEYRLCGDNVSSLLVIQKGFTPMSASWCSNRAYGLRLSVLHQQHCHRVFELTHVRSKFNMSDLASKVSHSRQSFLELSEMLGVSFGENSLIIPLHLHSQPNAKLSVSLV